MAGTGVTFKEVEKRLEDFLATDDMFVDYFNAFLSLPSFPEPVCFNSETGGFEVVSEAKKELGRQIKAAVRSQEKKPKIYSVTKKHSFRDIPLIPIEEPPTAANQEINTTFSVQTLNKEQGIHWIKAERLPVYLESECYLEYRLAHILSQVKMFGSQGCFINMKIDYSHRLNPVKKEAPKEPLVDPLASLKKEMFVCMGATNATETEAWFSTAKHMQNTDPTFVTNARPTSAIGIVTTMAPDNHRRIRPYSARPASSIRTPDYSRSSDSGVGSPLRDSLVGSTLNISNYACSVASIEEEGGGDVSEFTPYTPRPSQPVCYLSKDLPTQGPFYMPYPRSETTDSESGVGDIDTDRDDDHDIRDSQSHKLEHQMSASQKTKSIVPDLSIIRNIDELSCVLVGNVLSKAMASLNNLDIEDARQIPEIQELFPSKEFTSLPLDTIEDFEIQFPDKADEMKKASASLERQSSNAKSEESDADSLLDSEDDFEEQDSFFRKRRKKKKFDLANKKGIEEFKRFISGTVGEIYWNLWIDIDRCRQILDGQNQIDYAAKLKTKYHSPSAAYPLTNEMALKLGLSQPDCWNPAKLLSIQLRVAEPLVSYWSRRFLLKQERPLTSIVPTGQVSNRAINPVKSSGSLLPLRPKSCHPRMKQETQVKVDSHSVTQDLVDLKTSPLVGMKRTYSKAALEIIRRVTRGANKSSSGDIKITGEKSLLNPKLPAGTRVLPKPPTANAKDRIRPKTAGSVRSGKTLTSCVSSTKQTDFQDGGESRRSGSRPSSAKSDRSGKSISSSSSGSSKASSVFLGGKRMEGLLQALNSEKLSGGFFQRFVSRSNNKLWSNNLNFWNDVQEYHKCFHCASLDKELVQKKAKLIFSRFIVTGASQDVGCSNDIRNEVYRQLDPPFDELFDLAEENAISVLFIAWTQLLAVDNNTYKKVELIQVKRHLETKSKYVLRLQKRGLISERVMTPDDPMEGYEDPVYDETLIDKIPENFREFTLDKLIRNRLELEQFRQFLTDNYANMDLLCWMDIESYRRIPHTEEKKRDSKAMDIKVKYLNKKYFLGANSPAGKEGQDKVMTAAGGWGKLLDERPPNTVLLDIQKYVQDRLDKKWLPQFLALPEFSARQKPPQTMDNIIDDVMVQKRHKSQAVLKDMDLDLVSVDSDVVSIMSIESEDEIQMLESKWVTSSSDIMVFRKGLVNPVTSLQFRRYISIKGDSLENDVLFWLEVQKYKELHHTNTDDSILLHKINAIINCFLESSIPPALQVDIPQELADKIIDRKYEKGPYLFREAQLTVFRVLFTHWNEFCEYRSNLTPDKVLPTIERQRRRVKRKEREKQQKLEEQREKEAARRQALGLPPEGDFTDGDVFHDPFASKPEGSEAGDEKASTHGKDNISWTYSQYMAALETEDILNHLDESSLSSFTETGSLRVTDKEPSSVSLKTETVVKGTNKADSLQSSKQSKKDSKSDSNSAQEKGKGLNQNSLMPNKPEKDGKSDKSVASYKTEKTNTGIKSEKKQNSENVEKIQLVGKTVENGGQVDSKEMTDVSVMPSNVKRRKSLVRAMPPLVPNTK